MLICIIIETIPLFWYTYRVNITRQQQLLSNIKRIISTELRELNHELFHSVVVTTVHLSNNGEVCRVYVAAKPETINLLNTKFKSEIQHQFMKKFMRRKIPTLLFYPDTGEIEQIEQLLAGEK